MPLATGIDERTSTRISLLQCAGYCQCARTRSTIARDNGRSFTNGGAAVTATVLYQSTGQETSFSLPRIHPWISSPHEAGGGGGGGGGGALRNSHVITFQVRIVCAHSVMVKALLP
ncbi:Uncharacterised protein [Salmonella enterica subsp. enterica serovar Bovismorbificans]|uniref:Uncharacterized protein n=1 Tax=Salmonella enterica subsp. enterica serovar Bovismorbificans TaxID=58097 RepID=A0A655DX76_SALET|nr:Uncharacterised protein [Salmonella enterica subsp. enterica serovar Bovismorbificans]